MQELKVAPDNLDTELQKVRVNSASKAEFEKICKGLDITVAHAIRSYLQAVNSGEIKIVVKK